MCFFFYLIIYYRSRLSNILYKLWDINSVTPGDFTVEYQIPRDLYDEYIRRHPLENPDESKGLGFKIWFRKNIEKVISARDPVLSSERSDHRVAYISLAYKNQALLKLLTKRGGFIDNAQWAKAQLVEEQINQLKVEHLDDITVPVSAFITFET